jgi:uncharacterized protein (DUF1330 family)
MAYSDPMEDTMPALLIATVRVDDTEAYKKYTALTPDIVAKYGGRFIVRGGEIDTLEGEPFTERMVVIEYPDMETARAMYNSAEYQEAMVFRQAASQARFLLVETVPEGVTAPDAQVKTSG